MDRNCWAILDLTTRTSSRIFLGILRSVVSQKRWNHETLVCTVVGRLSGNDAMVVGSRPIVYMLHSNIRQLSRIHLDIRTLINPDVEKTHTFLSEMAKNKQESSNTAIQWLIWTTRDRRRTYNIFTSLLSLSFSAKYISITETGVKKDLVLLLNRPRVS